MLDNKIIDLQRKSFADFSDAADMCNLLRDVTGNDYTVSRDSALGYTFNKDASENIQQQQQHHNDDYGRDDLFFRQSPRGFIPHYTEVAIGVLLITSPLTVLDWIFTLLNIQTTPEWLNLSSWGNVITFAGYPLLLYGLRFVYSYYATSFCLEADSVILKKGIIARDQVQIRYSDIKTMNIKQSVLDRLLGIGTLSLDSAGTNGAVDIVFNNLINPVYMRQRIHHLMGVRVRNQAL